MFSVADQSDVNGVRVPSQLKSAALCAVRMRLARGHGSSETPGRPINKSCYLSAEGLRVAKRSA